MAFRFVHGFLSGTSGEAGDLLLSCPRVDLEAPEPFSSAVVVCKWAIVFLSVVGGLLFDALASFLSADFGEVLFFGPMILVSRLVALYSRSCDFL